jgi:hypothetical protein
MNVNDFLTRLGDAIPAWAVAGLLAAAGASFVARWRALTRYGRIREYGPRSLGVAAALGGLAVLYVFIEAGIPSLAGRPAVVRVLLGLLAVALTGFNWGGVRAVVHDLRSWVHDVRSWTTMHGHAGKRGSEGH